MLKKILQALEIQIHQQREIKILILNLEEKLDEILYQITEEKY